MSYSSCTKRLSKLENAPAQSIERKTKLIPTTVPLRLRSLNGICRYLQMDSAKAQEPMETTGHSIPRSWTAITHLRAELYRRTKRADCAQHVRGDGLRRHSWASAVIVMTRFIDSPACWGSFGLFSRLYHYSLDLFLGCRSWAAWLLDIG